MIFIDTLCSRSGALPLAAAIALLAAPAYGAGRERAAGDTYPDKPVRVIAASAPGGGTDIIARYTAQGLGEVWGQQAVVDNRAGGGGTIATDLVTKAAPDGYTLLVQSFGIAYVGMLRRNLPFDVLRDLLPLSLLASQPSLLAVHISVPATSVAELVQLAKNKPGQLQYGTSGAGGASHLGTELFASAAGVRLTAVQYKGTGPAFTALLGGEIQLAMVGVSTALPHVRAGRIRALGVTGAARSPLMPDIPSVSEAGLPGFEFDTWYGLFGPAKTPRAISAKINADVNRALRQPALRQRMAAIGVEPLGGAQEQFDRFFRKEVAKWSKVVVDAGIKSE
jgi:tripartite-type tricarboxylate transporter receptor subunit TctC